MTNKNVRIIAYYLPQFHPIPENDRWWGKGFTEWTNVGKAQPLFKGHYQPRVPADLGYYDLRIPEIRASQARMAQEYGIEGFCYWHYWFGNGKRLLEMPVKEIIRTEKPNFPFCLGWANETWAGFAHGMENRNTLIEQKYYGIKDYISHFYEVLPAFKDKRYITIENKPIFNVYKPLNIPDAGLFINIWQKLAKKNGLNEIFFIGLSNNIEFENESIINLGFNAINPIRLHYCARKSRSFNYYSRIWLKRRLNLPIVISYKKAMRYFSQKEDFEENIFPTIIPNWDHSPRSQKHGLILHKSTPELFKNHVKTVIQSVKHKKSEKRIVFLKSWNEWAEGNYIEPDLRYGKQYLQALLTEIVE